MNYLDFYKLSFLKFKRSPNFSKNLFLKILSIIGYIIILLYLIALTFLAYYGIKESFPQNDIFKKANEYLFIFLFLVMYAIMYIDYDSMKVKPFMILPVSKHKIIRFHLLQVLTHPLNIAFVLMLIIYIFLLSGDNYDLFGLTAWAIALVSLIYTLNYIIFYAGKNQGWNIGISLLFFLLLFKIKIMTEFFRPIGKVFYWIYLHPYTALLAVFLLGTTYCLIYKHLLQGFYTDDTVKIRKKKKQIRILKLPEIKIQGLTGSFIRNDIRLVLRNSRPRQALPGLIIFFLMAGFLFSDLGAQTHQPEFYKIMFSMFITGYFVVQFGNFIPAWDSEYYPLLMTQGIDYRQYIDAKWWLLTVSVLALSILAIPFIYFGWKVLVLIWAMAVFNIGVNIPLVLLTGVFNTQPIKLNKKVKAFQSNNHFKFKTFMIALLRLIIPIGIYLLIEKYAGFTYATGSFFAMGLLGLIYKNIILNEISKLYVRRKYKTLRAFKADE